MAIHSKAPPPPPTPPTPTTPEVGGGDAAASAFAGSVFDRRRQAGPFLHNKGAGGYSPNDAFLEQRGYGDLSRAVHAGIALPPHVVEAIKQALHASGKGVGPNHFYPTHDALNAASDADLLGSLVAALQHNEDRARGPLADLGLGDFLQDLGDLDFSGLTSAFIGDPNPHGLLGIQMDAASDLTGTRPEELLAVGRAGAGMLNPFVGLGLQVAPAAAYGTDLDPMEMARNYGLSRLVGYGLEQAAPVVSSGVDALRRLWADTGDMVTDIPAGGADVVLDSPGTFQDGGGMLKTGGLPNEPLFSTMPETNPFGTASTPAMTTYGGPSGTALGGVVAPSAMGDISGMLPLETDLDAEDAANRDALEAGDVLEQPIEPTVTSADLQRYVKVGKAVNELLQGAGDEPVRAEGESDEQYTEKLVEYLGLDAATMAAQGLQPGTPEYMEYILTQADAVINQVLGDMDVDAEDLSAQLRGKTEDELLALQRALFVRGQMDQLMGSGTYIDPVSGTPQEVIGEGEFNPHVGAYQQGRAGEVEALAGMGGDEALSFLDQILGRRADLFGMQSAADARMREAELEIPELRRRRGMFS